MKLTVLGSGTSMSSFYKPLDFRNTASYLLQTENANILLDSGEGVRGRLNEVGFDYFKLDAIFISHFHPDHFDLDGLIQSFYVRSRKEKRGNLLVYGPKNIGKIFEKSWDDSHRKRSFKDELNSNMKFIFNDYLDQESIFLKIFKITPFKVAHEYMDAYALRVENKGKILTFSGDSGECDALRKAATNADLFLCESATNIDEEVKEGHLNASQASEIAKKANAKKLVLTHYSGKDSKEEMIKEAQKLGFVGEVVVADDFQKFEI